MIHLSFYSKPTGLYKHSYIQFVLQIMFPTVFFHGNINKYRKTAIETEESMNMTPASFSIRK